MKKSYSELSRLETFEERYKYLKIGGKVGIQTFGFDRWINQLFYKSQEWLQARQQIILRDEGCDLGVPEYEIHTGLIVHHMNPISIADIKERADWIIDPEFLITASLKTHNAIHYGDENLLPRGPVVRKSGDTKLW